MICCIKGCEKTILSKGMCSMHYARMRKYGDPTKTEMKQLHGASLEARLSAYTDRRGSCWVWTGYRDANGYGRLNVGGRPLLTHRLAWEAHYGVNLTPDQHICHKCDNPKCVRPDHLFLGNQIANNADMRTKGRARQGVSKGEAHGRAKLTEEQVREIRDSTGSSITIAAGYGISGRQVRDIRARKVWKHLT